MGLRRIAQCWSGDWEHRDSTEKKHISASQYSRLVESDWARNKDNIHIQAMSCWNNIEKQ